jgi:hypothetical protein
MKNILICLGYTSFLNQVIEKTINKRITRWKMNKFSEKWQQAAGVETSTAE